MAMFYWQRCFLHYILLIDHITTLNVTQLQHYQSEPCDELVSRRLKCPKVSCMWTFIGLLECACISMQQCIVQRHLEKLRNRNARQNKDTKLPGFVFSGQRMPCLFYWKPSQIIFCSDLKSWIQANPCMLLLLYPVRPATKTRYSPYDKNNA